MYPNSVETKGLYDAVLLRDRYTLATIRPSIITKTLPQLILVSYQNVITFFPDRERLANHVFEVGKTYLSG